MHRLLVSNEIPWFRREVFGLAYDAGGNYRDCSLAELDRCITEAASHGKCLWWGDEHAIDAVMTWAMLPDERVNAYLQGDRVVGSDFACDEGQLWVMDFIAPYGGVARMMKQAQRYFSRTYGDGVVCNWKRPFRHAVKLGYAVMRDHDGQRVRQ